MKIPPVATYRIQFREGMTFDKAAALVPYLRRLGISHFYASPIFTAVSGSTHGYDVIDHNEIDPAIGGRDGFERLHTALAAAGMGLVLDIVPNHMAASLENSWWRSVVEFGADSPFAHHFDIDWRERLTLPILGRPLEEVLAAWELTIAPDEHNGCLAICYYDNHLPLHPATYTMLAEAYGSTPLKELAGLGRDREPASRFRDAVRAFLAGEDAENLSRQLRQASRNRELLERLLAAQPWRLTFWKDAQRHLTYRRFFEVTGLVGVRVEDETVFDDVHRLILSLVAEGKVDGLRIDHVDGLARPGDYLRRLRAAAGSDCWLLVEKIRNVDEPLPADWPDCGTTGYEFIPAVADLLVDREGLEALVREYDELGGSVTDIRREEREAKLLMLRRNFAGELARLGDMAAMLLGAGDPREIETALVELIAGFNVYRCYGEEGALSPADRERLGHAQAVAIECGVASPRAIERIVALLERPGTRDLRASVEFRTRFQQLTGPIMAKAVEDTLFYRVNPLIALNEVGATPGAAVGAVTRFHDTMERFRAEPLGLAATATHDTKRGEDARARLYALTEAPGRWVEAVRRWRGSNAHLRKRHQGTDIPEPEVEWMIAQMVCGAWPADAPSDAEGRKTLSARLFPAVEKALREAKLRTDWLAQDEAYESGVLSYVSKLFEPEGSAFLGDMETTLFPFLQAGAFNALAQTMAKLTGPAVPDIYQGAERLDLSLVDPDNRRPVDFNALAAVLSRSDATAPTSLQIEDGSFKQWMIATVLKTRARHLELFRRGRHVPLAVKGAAAAHYVAWLREDERAAAIVVVPRFTLKRLEAGLADADALLDLPDRYRFQSFRNVLTDTVFAGDRELSVAALCAGLPVALCLADR